MSCRAGTIQHHSRSRLLHQGIPVKVGTFSFVIRDQSETGHVSVQGGHAVGEGVRHCGVCPKTPLLVTRGGHRGTKEERRAREHASLTFHHPVPKSFDLGTREKDFFCSLGRTPASTKRITRRDRPPPPPSPPRARMPGQAQECDCCGDAFETPLVVRRDAPDGSGASRRFLCLECDLPPGWLMKTSKRTGRVYFYDVAKRSVQWSHPSSGNPFHDPEDAGQKAHLVSRREKTAAVYRPV